MLRGLPTGWTPDTKVVDFASTPLDVVTGTGTSKLLELDGAKGELTRVAGYMNLQIADFFALSGSVGIEKSSQTVQLANGQTVDTEMLLIGASGVKAFVGINGPYLVDSNDDGVIDDNDVPNADAIGLSLDDVEFGLALIDPKAGQAAELAGLNWMALEASAGAVELLGVPELTLSAKNLSVEINRVIGVEPDIDADDWVVDFAATPVVVVTGTDLSVTLEFPGSRGELIRASGDVAVAVSEFFFLSGTFGFEEI